jgi:hypothetical protein
MVTKLKSVDVVLVAVAGRLAFLQRNSPMKLSLLYTVDWRLKSNHRSWAASKFKSFALNLNESGN